MGSKSQSRRLQVQVGLEPGDIVRARDWPATQGERFVVTGFGMSKEYGAYARVRVAGARNRISGVDAGPIRCIPLDRLVKVGR